MSTATAKSAHTLGPWTMTRGQCDGETQAWFDVDGAPEAYPDTPHIVFPHSVCMVYSHEGAAEANARLIAAAPELLLALKAMVASYDGLRDALYCPTVLAKLAAADAAIAKAEGRS